MWETAPLRRSRSLRRRERSKDVTFWPRGCGSCRRADGSSPWLRRIGADRACARISKVSAARPCRGDRRRRTATPPHPWPLVATGRLQLGPDRRGQRPSGPDVAGPERRRLRSRLRGWLSGAEGAGEPRRARAARSRGRPRHDAGTDGAQASRPSGLSHVAFSPEGRRRRDRGAPAAGVRRARHVRPRGQRGGPPARVRPVPRSGRRAGTGTRP